MTAQFLAQHWQHHLVQVLCAMAGSDRCTAGAGAGRELVAVDEAAARGEAVGRRSRAGDALRAWSSAWPSSGLDDQVAGEWMAGLARAMAFPDAPRECARCRHAADGDDSDDTRCAWSAAHAALDFDPAVAERMRELAPGSWLRLMRRSGEEGSVKVAWVSPLTWRRLLVNRRGLRKLVASPEQLAALAKAGKLLRPADLPFDEAMRHARAPEPSVAAAA